MKINPILLILCWTCNMFVFSSHTHTTASSSFYQSNHTGFVDHLKKQNPIPFKQDSYVLSDSAKDSLDVKSKLIIEQIHKGCSVVLNDCSCPNELKKNPNIGILRGKSIIDYLEKKYQCKRFDFYISDRHLFGDDNEPCGDAGIVEIGFLCCNGWDK